jgi:hypothetical protein
MIQEDDKKPCENDEIQVKSTNQINEGKISTSAQVLKKSVSSICEKESQYTQSKKSSKLNSYIYLITTS